MTESPTGAAVLLAGYVNSDQAPDTTLIRALGQIGESILAAAPQWRVVRLAPGAAADHLPEQVNIERELVSLGDRAIDVAIVVAVGQVTRSDGMPAFVASTTPDLVGTTGSLRLATIGALARASSAARIAIVFAGWDDDGAHGPNDPDVLEHAWLEALATGRQGDLVAVAAGPHAAPTIEALRDGLAGTAIDPRTGTITVRSLGEYLARALPGLALRSSALAETVISPPPLTSLYDPRLNRRAPRARSGVSPQDADPAALIGTTLPGRFRIDAVLARGAFGTVYRARQLSVERDVAIKVLYADIDPSSPTGRLFVQEIRSVGRIDHPNVVRIYQADMMHDGRLFFAMELLSGRDLEQLIADEGRMPTARALATIEQLLAGLEAAHEADLVHADLKPANVLIVPTRHEPRIVLVDFGLSRLRSSSHSADSVGGTPAYMAPEQLHSGRVDARSDLFSAALVLVTLMTGWRRRSADALVPPLDDIEDGRLRLVLQRALALDPSERFATAAEFAHALLGRPHATLPSPNRGARAPRTEQLESYLYGRDHEVDLLAEHLVYRGGAVLAGSRAIGKTSVLRRGVLPRLAVLGAHVVYVACQTGAPTVAAAAIARGIDADATDPAAAAARWQARGPGKLVIAIDQLEALLPPVARCLDDVVVELLNLQRWPPGVDLAVIACVRTPGPTSLQLRNGAAAEVVTLGLLSRDSAREAIAGEVSTRRMEIDDELLDLLAEDLAVAAPRTVGTPPGVFPPQLLRACTAICDALPLDEVRLTRANYERAGGASMLADLANHRRRPWRRRIVLPLLAILAVAVTSAAIAITTREGPRQVFVGGSGTVLFGFLQPIRPFVEDRSGCVVPVDSKFDLGSGGAIRSLRSGDIDIAALSARFDQALPSDLRAAGKLMVEVPVGYDETALFVHRDNPLRELDIAPIRSHLCCGHDQRFAAVTWAELGMPTGPLANHAVAWTLFGRTEPPLKNDTTSSTVLQADAWLCAPRQLCPTLRPVEVEANDVLAELVTSAEVLALSTRAFSTDQVVALRVVDRQQHARLDGRKLLWLYLALAGADPMPRHLCRLLDVLLDPTIAQQLAPRHKAQGLPDVLRVRQRAALGLDDGSCDTSPLAGRARDDELASGILRSPIADDLAIKQRWIAN